MSVEVIVAIISGCAAIAGASIACVQAIRTNRLKTEADAKLEQMKAETNIAVENMKEERGRRQIAFELASNESAPLEAALAQAWEDIQLVKEIVSKVASPDRYDVDIALRQLELPSSRLTDGYAKWGARIPEQARKAWHSAKGEVSAFKKILVIKTSNDDLPSDMSDDISDILKETRTSLTDHQMALSASLQSIRDSTIKHLLELV